MKQTIFNRYLTVIAFASFFVSPVCSLQLINNAYHYINSNIVASIKEANHYVAGFLLYP